MAATYRCHPSVREILEPAPFFASPVSTSSASSCFKFLVLALLCFGSPGLFAQGVGESPVWVNQSSGVYHCKGTRYYGKTRVGEFLPETTARARGHRPAGGRTCIAELNPQTLGIAAPGPVPHDNDEPRDPVSTELSCLVDQIVDGDTIRCRRLGRVRLIGIDAPEMDEGATGIAARAMLESLTPPGSTIELESDLQRRDRYGRILAYGWVSGRQLNYLMVRSGWAVVSTYPPNVRHVDSFTRGQRRAREAGLGLWNRR